MKSNYKDIIKSFVSNNLTATEFETAYIRIFTNDKAQVEGADFDIIENLFFDVDDYVEDPALRKEVGGIGPDDLRDRAQVAFEKLYG